MRGGGGIQPLPPEHLKYLIFYLSTLQAKNAVKSTHGEKSKMKIDKDLKINPSEYNNTGLYTHGIYKDIKPYAVNLPSDLALNL